MEGEVKGRETGPRLVLMGAPNVGKSALFWALTGMYATISNYPGTTVEVTRGRAVIGNRTWEVIDTPGLYSLLPITEEEKVARAILFTGPELVLHVVDGKHLERSLALTLQLMDTGLPLILVVNMLDEAERAGIKVDLARLQERLGIPVVGTAAATGRGLEELKASVSRSWHRTGEREAV
ncbi:MAG: FeoB small GTPase domain-containing protein [Clostridia bacterium]|nr:50S ribosome-binding GTPase [Clostridia bacterium]MDH7573240.1 FeoB small GTPase domain-containing protein [Clostridia bacterium]